MTKPSLIEPGMKYYMDSALENSRIYKAKLYNYAFNGILTLLFLSLIATILYYGYKNKKTTAEREKEDREKTQKIIEKVRSLNSQYSNPNPNIFQDTREPAYNKNNKNNNYDSQSLEYALANDPYSITNLPPLKFM